ncbi:MAG: hypothetical protein LUQ20_04705 [Candidatus Methanoperedens sp.]|nr:hypothetical protein [Candidatus Methanoperedens sp.]
MPSEKPDGFKYALTLISALGTSLFFAYNYFQTTVIGVYWYAFINGVLSVSLILLFLLLYIFFRGVSMEIVDPYIKERLENWASKIYLLTFLMFIITLIYIVYFFVIAYAWTKIDQSTIQNILISIYLIIFIIVVVFAIKHRRNLKICTSLRQKILTTVFSVFLILIVGSIIWLSAFSPILAFMQGHVIIDMDSSIYYKNNTPIPIYIKVTGPNTNLSIYLYENENNQTQLTPFDYIVDLKPDRDFNITLSHNNSLIGNSLENGKYIVFINKTKLSSGYHELVVKNIFYGKMDVKGFYLLNASNN